MAADGLQADPESQGDLRIRPALAEQRKVPITQLSLREWKKISPEFDASALEVFSLEKALPARTAVGSPNPKLVRQQLARWQKILVTRKKQRE